MTKQENIKNTNFYFELIAKECTGEISKEENTILHEWVNQAEENRMHYEDLVKSWSITSSKIEVPEFNTEMAWDKLSGKLDTSLDGEMQTIGNASFSIWKIAATILFVVGVMSIMKLTLWKEQAPELLAFSSKENELELYLPDSSKVYLNRNSQLSYYTDFNSKERKVYLDGEAFFEVRKSEGKKFEVIGNRSVTTVLGTSFNVRTIKGEANEWVQVVTGKVSFASLENKKGEKNILLPGDMCVMDSVGQLTRNKIKDPNFISWKENKLAFDNTPMAEVKSTVEAYFGIVVEVQDPLLLNCRFTGTFDVPDQEEFLEVLAISTNSTYQVNGNKITFVGKGCKE